jgi:hypothetical protein
MSYKYTYLWRLAFGAQPSFGNAAIEIASESCQLTIHTFNQNIIHKPCLGLIATAAITEIKS